MPTPPPWWTETQVAPLTALSRALRIGQSPMASEPSRIPSVSRLGEATEPQSRWSRPITIGAFTSPRGHQLVEHPAGLGALAVAQPADARRQALEGDALAGQADPARQRRVLGEGGEDRLVGRREVLRIAGEHGPAERPLALAEQRPDEQRHEAADLEGAGLARRQRLAAQVVAVVEGDRPALLEREHGADVGRHRGHGARDVGRRVAPRAARRASA